VSGAWRATLRRDVGIAFALLSLLVGCAKPDLPSATPSSSRAPDRLVVSGPTATSSSQPWPTILPVGLGSISTPVVLPRSQTPQSRSAAAPTPPAPITTSSPTPAALGIPAKLVPVNSARPTTPQFSDVAQRSPSDVVSYLQGQLPDYPAGRSSSIVDFSPADILETMDTAVLDQVKRAEGNAALQRVYDVIASEVLTTIREEYSGQTVVVALDAGHGGKAGFFWDAGSEGTEATHTRGVAQAVVRQAQQLDSSAVIIRPIYNDSIADDLGVTGPRNRPTINQLVVRQTRAAMLADEITAWNRENPDAPVALHEISVHFNSGAGGALVLHQGDTVRPEFRDRSTDFGKKYLERVIAALNATGVLPTPLRRWGDSGLHDDVMLYRPSYLNGLPLPAGFTPRYGMLQGGSYVRRYVNLVLGQGG
jgi:hypothetical protein